MHCTLAHPRLDAGKPQDDSRAKQAAVLSEIRFRFGEKIMSKNRNGKSDSNAPDNGRRNFLKGATLAGAAALTTAPAAANTVASPPQEPRAKAAVPGPELAA